jgi:hypothetical protein
MNAEYRWKAGHDSFLHPPPKWVVAPPWNVDKVLLHVASDRPEQESATAPMSELVTVDDVRYMIFDYGTDARLAGRDTTREADDVCAVWGRPANIVPRSFKSSRSFTCKQAEIEPRGENLRQTLSPGFAKAWEVSSRVGRDENVERVSLASQKLPAREHEGNEYCSRGGAGLTRVTPLPAKNPQPIPPGPRRAKLAVGILRIFLSDQAHNLCKSPWRWSISEGLSPTTCGKILASWSSSPSASGGWKQDLGHGSASHGRSAPEGPLPYDDGLHSRRP